jgi:exonuclease III
VSAERRGPKLESCLQYTNHCNLPEITNTFWNERIIEGRLKLTRGYITVLGIYSSVDGKEEESESFYKLLQKVIDKVNKSDMSVLMGDFNARIGRNKVKGLVRLVKQSVITMG